MNTKTIAFGILVCLAAGCSQRTEAPKAVVLKDDRQKASYTIGLNIGNNLKQQDMDVDYDAFVRGVKDARTGGPLLLSEAETREAIAKLQQQMLGKQQARLRQFAGVNKQQGEAFLAENKNKPGVVTLPSGLQYKIVKEGDGPVPKPDESVTINYRGTFINGVEFDSSAKLSQPPTFAINNPAVFPGWAEALTHMKTGAKWQLYIPSNLAYGEAGRSPVIGPNTTLLLEIELLAVHPKPATPAPSQPLTSDIIKVPSAEEMQKGAQIETIKPEDLEKLQKQQSTNQPAAQGKQ